MVIKPRLEFKLLNTPNIADNQFLVLNLKNVGNRILKSLVVQLHSPEAKSNSCYRCFTYVLMPYKEETVKFQVFSSSLKHVFFSVSGYASGDAYFYVESPIMVIQTKDHISKVC